MLEELKMTKKKSGFIVTGLILLVFLTLSCNLFSSTANSSNIANEETKEAPATQTGEITISEAEESSSEVESGEVPGNAVEAENPVAEAPGDSSHLQPTDFVYQGAFRLPEDFDWGARGLSYYPLGDGGVGSLLVTGPESHTADFGEVGIPVPVIEADWQKLPVAPLLRPLTNFDGNLIEDQIDSTTTYVGSIEYVPKQGSQTSDKIYGSADWWYAVMDETFPTIWFSELDGSNPRGLFHVGEQAPPFHGNRTGDYLFKVPQWYADQYLGGRFLITGKSRGTSTGSQGPAMYAFRPWDTENPSGNLDAIPLVWYRFIYPECAGPNVGEKSACDYPEFTMCDKWLGASFIESGDRRAIVMLGVKGLGDNGYGQPTNPDACNPYQGYHCDPLERQVIFFDVNELGQAALGNRDPWSVAPYAIWKPETFYLQGHTCGETGDMAFDPVSGRVFMVEKGIGDNNSAVVHVWTVND
jgi:hypothetical protein